jgi:hypothetical protein
MKKRQAIILGSIFLVIVVILIIALVYKSKMSGIDANEPDFKIEFMNDKEKETMNIDPSVRVQVLERDSSGKAMTYKVIVGDNDVVNSLDEVR